MPRDPYAQAVSATPPYDDDDREESGGPDDGAGLPHWDEVDVPTTAPHVDQRHPVSAAGAGVVPIGARWREDADDEEADDEEDRPQQKPQQGQQKQAKRQPLSPRDPRAAQQIFYSVEPQTGDDSNTPTWRIFGRRTRIEIAAIIAQRVGLEPAAYKVVEWTPRRPDDPESHRKTDFFFVRIPEDYTPDGKPKAEHFQEPAVAQQQHDPWYDAPPQSAPQADPWAQPQPVASGDPSAARIEQALSRLSETLADRERREQESRSGWRPSDFVGMAGALVPLLIEVVRPRPDNSVQMLQAMVAISKDLGRPGWQEAVALGVAGLPTAISQVAQSMSPYPPPQNTYQPPLPGQQQPTHPPLPAPRTAAPQPLPTPAPQQQATPPAQQPQPAQPAPSMPNQNADAPRTPEALRDAMFRRLSEASRAGKVRQTMPGAYAARIVEAWSDEAIVAWLQTPPEQLLAEMRRYQYAADVSEEGLHNWLGSTRAAVAHLLQSLQPQPAAAQEPEQPIEASGERSSGEHAQPPKEEAA